MLASVLSLSVYVNNRKIGHSRNALLETSRLIKLPFCRNYQLNEEYLVDGNKNSLRSFYTAISLAVNCGEERQRNANEIREFVVK